MSKIEIIKHPKLKKQIISASGKLVRIGMQTGYKTRIIPPSQLRTRALIVHDGKVLLISGTASSRGCWTLPGGGIKKNESPQRAMVREVKEEVCLDIPTEKWQEIGIFKKSQTHIRYDVICYYHEIESPE